MKYGDILTRALAISWRHKYLWLLAIFAGESAVGLSLPSVNRPALGQNSVSYRLTSADWTRFTDWATINAGWLWAAGIACVAVCVLLFLVSVPAHAALVSGAAAHDAGRASTLGEAWSAGMTRFWPVLAIKAFAALVALTSFLVVAGLWTLAGVYGVMGSYGISLFLGVAGALAVAVAVPFWVVFAVVVALAIRAAVLDGKGPNAAMGAAFHLVFRRFGRVALMWLLIGVAGMLAGFLAGLVAAALLVPVAGIVIAAYFAGGVPVAVASGIILGLPWLAAVIAISGGVSAFTSSCWTLSYSRFDAEPGPAAQPLPTRPVLA